MGLSLHTPNVSHCYPNRPAAPGQPQPSRAPAPPSPSQNSRQLPCLSAVLCAGPRGTHHGAPEPSWDGAHSEEGDWLMEGGCGDASRCLGLLICKVRVTSAPALRGLWVSDLRTVPGPEKAGGSGCQLPWPPGGEHGRLCFLDLGDAWDGPRGPCCHGPPRGGPCRGQAAGPRARADMGSAPAAGQPGGASQPESVPSAASRVKLPETSTSPRSATLCRGD